MNKKESYEDRPKEGRTSLGRAGSAAGLLLLALFAYVFLYPIPVVIFFDRISDGALYEALRASTLPLQFLYETITPYEFYIDRLEDLLLR